MFTRILKTTALFGVFVIIVILTPAMLSAAIFGDFATFAFVPWLKYGILYGSGPVTLMVWSILGLTSAWHAADPAPDFDVEMVRHADSADMAIVEETFREIFGDKYDELFENQPRE
jgi:energy-coupling factor transporter transmembrane protein EcfT